MERRQLVHGNNHFVGSMVFQDVHTKLVHQAGFIMETFGQHLGKFTVIHPVTDARDVEWIREPQRLILFRNMMGMLRDSSGVTYTEEERRIKTHICMPCGGRGGAEDAAGNWIECIACEGQGMV